MLILYKLINTFLPELFFFSIYILMIVPFTILLIQKNKPIVCLFNTSICISCMFLFIFIWGKLFQIFTVYTPHNYITFHDIAIGVLIVMTSILFYVFYDKKIKYKFNLSQKSQILIIAQICLFITFFTIIYPLMMYSNSVKLHAVGSLIFIVIVFIFIKVVIYVLSLEKIKQLSMNELKVALNLRNTTDKQLNFIIEKTHYYKELIANIGYFIAISDIEGLKNYYNEKLMKSFVQILNEMNNENYILETLKSINGDETLIKACIHQYYVKTKSLKNVHFRLSINSYIDGFYIDKDDLFEILNIILSNAIEELESINIDLRKKLFTYLSVSIEKDDKMIQFVITNTVNSIKIDKFNHYGEGIKIARKLEKRYKDKLDIQLIPQEKIYKSIVEIRL